MKRNNRIIEIVKLILGAALMSFAFIGFLLPNNLVTGGVAGIGVVLEKTIGWSASFFSLAMNVPLLIICLVFLGKGVFYRTVLAGLLYPLLMIAFDSMPAITLDPMLAAIFGGALSGVGMGLVFNTNSSSGGTGILAQLANKYTGISLSNALMVIDGAIVLVSLFVFDLPTMLYSILSLYISVQATDYIMVGGLRSVAIQIISEKDEEIKQAIYEKLDRGITRIVINSNFNPSINHMLLCVMPTRQFVKCKRIVLSIDPNAFILANDVREVAGRGFTSNKEYGYLDDGNNLEQNQIY